MNYYQLSVVFNGPKSHWVKGADGKIIGKGMMETDLEEMGYRKSELRRLVASSILKKFQVRLDGAIRNSYVFLLGGLEDVRDVEKATEKQPKTDAGKEPISLDSKSCDGAIADEYATCGFDGRIAH